MLEKFKQRNKPEVVADLDAMLVESVAFKFHGREHVIEPITLNQFMQFTNDLVSFKALDGTTALSPDQVIDGYWNLVKGVAPSVTREDIEKATQTQLGSLFSLIVRTITGETFATEKKTLKTTETTNLQH